MVHRITAACIVLLLIQNVFPNSRAAVFPCEFRSISGFGNNICHPSWGTPYKTLDRLSAPAYENGNSSPSGADRPGARLISDSVNAQDSSIPAQIKVSDFFWAWGQIVDHDIDLTEPVIPPEPFNIPVPCGDPYFDPDSNCNKIIPFNRSIFVNNHGIRQQINEITAFLDGSVVYGSDSVRAKSLRLFDGSGKLKTSDGDLLPFNTEGLPNAPDNSSEYFLAGDVRANENVVLTSLQTLLVREHNLWCNAVKQSMPTLNGEMIYNIARAIVVAEIQSITYNEYLPLLLGRNAINKYRGYNPGVKPVIFNEFATASYRFGHSMISNILLRLDNNGNVIPAGNLQLRNAFFNPQQIIQNGGIEPILYGLVNQIAQEFDIYIANGLRNFLFGLPGEGGFDLASLNIQRGRDHGITDYNEVRVMIGLPPVFSFSDISSNNTVVKRLSSVYGSVDKIDLWVGGLAEDHYPGAIAGATVRTILTQQFQTLRASDRFWYQAYLPCTIVKLIEKRTLSDIIIDNSDVQYEKFPKNAFLVKQQDCIVSNRNKNKVGLGKKSSDPFDGTIGEIVAWYSSIDNNNIATGIQPIRNFAKLNIQKDKVLFSTPVKQIVTMQLFTVTGKKIATLIPKSTLNAGIYTIALPVRGKGVYVIHAKGENFNFSQVVSDSF